MQNYASTVRPSTKLFHSMHFFSLQLQPQREVRHLANEQSMEWAELFLQGRRGWPVASFVFPETQLCGASRVRIWKVNQWLKPQSVEKDGNQQLKSPICQSKCELNLLFQESLPTGPLIVRLLKGRAALAWELTFSCKLRSLTRNETYK